MEKLNAKVVCHNLAHDMFALCRELQKRGLNSPGTETQIHFYSKSCLKQDLRLLVRWEECQDHAAMGDGLLQQSDMDPVTHVFFRQRHRTCDWQKPVWQPFVMELLWCDSAADAVLVTRARTFPEE